jgi:hypothetical protein
LTSWQEPPSPDGALHEAHPFSDCSDAAALAAQLDKLPEALGKLGKQAAVTEIALRTDPADSRVRPFETLVVQVRSYGKDGDKKVRLRRSVTRVK